MNIWRFCKHQNQQVILTLLFYQASHEGRIYSLPNLQKWRRVTVSRPVCIDLKGGLKLNFDSDGNFSFFLKNLNILCLLNYLYCFLLVKRSEKPRFLLDFLGVYINRVGKVLGTRLLFDHQSAMASRGRTYFVRFCCVKA